VLDEPTNHLDIHTRETLEEMLAEFDGTILFVSHDRFFIDRIATRTWAIDDGAVSTFLGNYTEYQRQLGRRVETAAAKPAEPKPELEAVSAPPPKRHSPAVLSGRAQKSLLQVERDIGRLEGKLNELSDALTVAGIDGDVAALERLSAEFERAQAELDGAYAKWEELSASIAEAEAESSVAVG
jgi:ATP-binding cassette subfamily F protein 3